MRLLMLEISIPPPEDRKEVQLVYLHLSCYCSRLCCHDKQLMSGVSSCRKVCLKLRQAGKRRWHSSFWVKHRAGGRLVSPRAVSVWTSVGQTLSQLMVEKAPSRRSKSGFTDGYHSGGGVRIRGCDWWTVFRNRSKSDPLSSIPA